MIELIRNKREYSVIPYKKSQVSYSTVYSSKQGEKIPKEEYYNVVAYAATDLNLLKSLLSEAKSLSEQAAIEAAVKWSKANPESDVVPMMKMPYPTGIYETNKQNPQVNQVAPGFRKYKK